MRELIQLRLPRIVEARRKRESSEPGLDPADLQTLPPLLLSQSSTPSDLQSPLTPTVSLKGHSRFPSSSSSLSSSPIMRSSVEVFAAKRPLTEVKEDPLERDEDFEMLDEPSQYVDTASFSSIKNKAKCMDYDHYDGDDNDDDNADDLDVPVYDWIDGVSYGTEDLGLTVSKRRRAEKPTPSFMSARFGSRFPNLSGKWKIKSKKRSSSITESFQDAVTPAATRSRASSMRSSTVHETGFDALEKRDLSVLPTPAESFVEAGDDDMPSTPAKCLQQHEDNRQGDLEAPNSLARTPLLPPVTAVRLVEEHIQSPLQSPKVADSPGVPRTSFDSPYYHGLPSPPLSSRPSVTSFHHRQLLPSSEIPPIILADPQDEWAIKLGHANFTIDPAPYLPENPSLEACRQLRADWETARCNFLRHLARTGANYSTTSKVYALTQAKWATVDALWKRHLEDTFAAVVAWRSEEVSQLSRQPSLHEPTPVAKIPSINGPGSEGKFPKIGDVGIVGPMEQVKPMSRQKSPKKRTFWKFLQGVLPTSVAFGRSQG